MQRRQALFAIAGWAALGGALFAADPAAKPSIWDHFKLKDLAELKVETAMGKTVSKDKVLLDQVTTALRALPAEGDIFVKISGDAPQTKLTLTGPQGTLHTLVFYDRTLQAPDTKFYTEDKDKNQALRLLDLVNRAR